MTKKEQDFSLDQSAEDLYKQFAGLDESDRAKIADSSESALMNLLNQQEKLLDYYRLLLSEATCLFAGILNNSRFAALAQETDQKIKIFIATLRKIAKFPEFDGLIYCRLRGQQRPADAAGSETYDYELSFNKILLDYQIAQLIEEREKSHGKAIYGKLLEAFQALSNMNIFNFAIDIGDGTDEDYENIEKSLRTLMRFYGQDSYEEGFVVLEFGNKFCQRSRDGK